jgi:hypothetical protein
LTKYQKLNNVKFMNERVIKLRQEATQLRVVAFGSLIFAGMNLLTATKVYDNSDSILHLPLEIPGTAGVFLGGIALLAALGSVSREGRANTEEILQAVSPSPVPEEAPTTNQ